MVKNTTIIVEEDEEVFFKPRKASPWGNPGAAPRRRTHRRNIDLEDEYEEEYYQETQVQVSATPSSQNARPQRQISPEEEADFEEILDEAEKARREQEPGLASRVYTTVSSFLYSAGEPAEPTMKVEKVERRSKRREQQEHAQPNDRSRDPRSPSFIPPAVATAKATAVNALAAAAKIDRLVREFPEAFGATPADPFAPSDVVVRDPSKPDPKTTKPTITPTTGAIPEAKLRRFLIREGQIERPDAHLNPKIARVPVASRKFLSDNVPTTLAGSKAASARARVGSRVRVQHALQDAERYKQPTEVLWNDYFSIGVKGVSGWQALVEQRIEQARMEGQFENLPGAGEKIRYLEDDPAARNPFLDNVEYHLNKSIKAQGLRPVFVEQSLEIEAEIASLRRDLRQTHRNAVTNPLTNRSDYEAIATPLAERRIAELNDKIRTWNITIPKGIPRKLLLELKREIERGKESEADKVRNKAIEELKMDEAMKLFFERL